MTDETTIEPWHDDAMRFERASRDPRIAKAEALASEAVHQYGEAFASLAAAFCRAATAVQQAFENIPAETLRAILEDDADTLRVIGLRDALEFHAPPEGT